MAVYIVQFTYLPNGNKCSRPIVADCPEDAQAFMEVEHELAEHDPNFAWTVTERPDPDGQYAADLLDGERRRRMDELMARR